MNFVRICTYGCAGISVLMLCDLIIRGPADRVVPPPRVVYAEAPVTPPTPRDTSEATGARIPVGAMTPAVPLTNQTGMPNPSSAPQGWDIIGIRPGMTPEQVRSALVAYRPEGRFWPTVERWADDSDFTRTLSWDATMVDPKDPTKKLSTETVAVIFSGPASGNRAVAVKRNSVYTDGPENTDGGLVADRLRDSLHQKYGTSPESNRFGGDYTGVREKLLVGADGQIIPSHRAYGTGACSLTIGRETTDGLGNFDGTCGNVTMSWQIRGQRIRGSMVDSFTIEIKDIGFAIGATTYDQANIDRAREDAANKRSQGNQPRL